MLKLQSASWPQAGYVTAVCIHSVCCFAAKSCLTNRPYLLRCTHLCWESLRIHLCVCMMMDIGRRDRQLHELVALRLAVELSAHRPVVGVHIGIVKRMSTCLYMALTCTRSMCPAQLYLEDAIGIALKHIASDFNSDATFRYCMLRE